MSKMGRDVNGHVVQGFGFGVSSGSITVDGTSRQSQAVGGLTTWVMLWSTVAAYVKIGPNPTAVADATSFCIPANTSFFVPIQPGEKVAFLQQAGAGAAFVNECL